MRSRTIDRALALAIAIIISVYVTAQSSATTQNNNESDWEEKFRAIPQAERMKTWGLDVTIEEFDVLFPTPKERILELTAPEKYQAKLKEPALAEDPDSGDENQLPTYNAYSGDGDVTGRLVYITWRAR